MDTSLYNVQATDVGGFNRVFSDSTGRINQPMGIPYYKGRSILASIPDYQRNPLQLEKDLIIKVTEGRINLMKLLYQYAESNGQLTVPDVKWRFPVEVDPNRKFYLKSGTYTCSSNQTVFTLSTFSRPKPAAISVSGNPQVVGDIARLEVGDFVLLMFAWQAPGRTAKAKYSGSEAYVSSPSSYPIPEIGKVVAVDYANNKVTVERNWAGAQRTASNPGADTVVVGTADTNCLPKDAFFVKMAKSMEEDEIDAKIHSYTGTFSEALLQRHLTAWGSQHLVEVITGNLGVESPLAKSKRLAIDEFYRAWEWTAVFGEKKEWWNPETGWWSGTSDGLLTNIQKSHYWGIKPIDFDTIGTSSQALGSFHPIIFNKLMQDKAFYGSQNKTLLVGADFALNFASMINMQTQNVPDIKSEWRVEGKAFTTSDGLRIDVVPSDIMTLYGMRKHAILFDTTSFKKIGLKNYPVDMITINNENPLKDNGFIHGMMGFIDTMPDAHWVFVLDSNAEQTGSPLED